MPQFVITVYQHTYVDKPTVNPLPHQILGVLDEQFQITCHATNDKDAPHTMMFTWITPDGVGHNVNMTSEDDHTASSTLYISSLARSDGGTYKCYVTNNNVSNARVVTSTTVIVKGLCYNMHIILGCNIAIMLNRTSTTAIEFYCY